MAQLVEYLPIGLGFESSEPMEKPGTVTSLSVLLPGEIPKTEGPGVHCSEPRGGPTPEVVL